MVAGRVSLRCCLAVVGVNHLALEADHRNDKNVPTRPARELHPGGDSYVVHYNSFLGHHHDDDLIRSNCGTNQEAVCISVD